ncbi:2-C-methyl-D-erythritol 4-phosphate cytidylyltransferase [candidate division KSB1 bacterium]|nr:2-C-methyl-D-erythritol 4-phosphate cytidylyltransferase [candidate division KSB1 bacterium]
MLVTAIIVAAGSGKRIGGRLPKQFLSLLGKPILQHTLEKFQVCDDINKIVLVAPQDMCSELPGVCREQWHIEKLSRVVPGGAERPDSVWAGLSALDHTDGYVLIHDGVRPFIRVEKIVEIVAAVKKYDAVVVGVTPNDTIKIIKGQFAVETPARNSLVQVQTPQAFHVDLIKKAYTRAFRDGFVATDDAALVERMGKGVFLVRGDHLNFKITSPEDLKIAEMLLQKQDD